jgi:hypothetical protein
MGLRSRNAGAPWASRRDYALRSEPGTASHPRGGGAMKRLLLLLALVLLTLGVVAAPALAWDHIQLNTAYITSFRSGWDSWNGPSDPFGTTHHTGAIPHSWKVVVGLTWMDSQTGAKPAPVEMLHTFAFHKVNGTWSRAVTDPLRAVKYWDAAYEWDSVTYPGVWAIDWWVPLGKLAPGTYKGWVRQQVISQIPTWMDNNGAIVTDPIWVKAYSVKYAHTYTVK